MSKKAKYPETIYVIQQTLANGETALYAETSPQAVMEGADEKVAEVVTYRRVSEPTRYETVVRPETVVRSAKPR